MLVGYARVSTVEQDTRLQLDALKHAGVSTVFQDKGSGVGPRPQLRVAISSLKVGDTFVVWKLDRIARSLSDLLSIIEAVKAAGAAIRSLTEPIDTSSALGELALQMLGAFAQFERRLIRERCIAGQVAYLERGGVFGRPKHLTPEQEIEVAQALSRGATKASLQRQYGVGYIVIRRVEREMNGHFDTGRLPVLRKYVQ